MRQGSSVMAALLVPVATGAALLVGSGAGVASPAAAALTQQAAPAKTAPATSEAELAIRAHYRCLGRFDAVDVTAFFFNRSPA